MYSWDVSLRLRKQRRSYFSYQPGSIHFHRRLSRVVCIVSHYHLIISDAIHWYYSRSSGPGGQHVNKVNTKAELQISLTFKENSCGWIPPSVLPILLQSSLYPCTNGGKLIVRSDMHRSLLANKEECIKKALRLLREAGQRALPVVTSPEQLEKVDNL